MNLDELRAELEEVDRQLLSCVARRQELAAEIGRTKQKIGVPTRDYGQERDVMQRALAIAGDLGVSKQLAEALTLLLIQSSLTVQEQDRVASGGEGSGRRVLIIGGSGKMGRWFVRFLSSQGYAVEVADPAGDVVGCRCYRDWKEAKLDHHIIIVAAPLRASAAILSDLACRPPAGLVFDIGSLKSPLRAPLLALARSGARVTSIHPMFGPDTELLSGRHIVFVDVGNQQATADAKNLFASTMAIQVDMDLESHDRIIAYILGLAHALNIAFFTALAESGESAPRLAEVSSTTFNAQLEVASRVAAENPHLYFEIQSLNDYGTESLTALLLAIERLRSVVHAADEAAFARLMEQGHKYLAARFHESQGQ
jgi:chorismate mutase / prephenate dehydrogenase